MTERYRYDWWPDLAEIRDRDHVKPNIPLELKFLSNLYPYTAAGRWDAEVNIPYIQTRPVPERGTYFKIQAPGVVPIDCFNIYTNEIETVSQWTPEDIIISTGKHWVKSSREALTSLGEI